MSESRESLVDEIHPKLPIKIHRNKSCYFLLPILGYGNTGSYYGLLNCYLGDNYNKPELNFTRIFIHVKLFDNNVVGLRHFDSYYRLEDGTYMYIFKIPEEYTGDYNKFIAGKYSEMSDSAKQILVKATGVKPVMNSIVYKVLFKTADQRDKIEQLVGQPLLDEEEVYTKPDLDKELYQGPLGLFRSKEIELGGVEDAI